MNKYITLKKVKNLHQLNKLLGFAEHCLDDLTKEDNLSFKLNKYIDFKDQLATDNDFLLYLNLFGKTIGVLLARYSKHEVDTVDIDILVIKNKYRDQGYGSYLIKCFEKICKAKNIKKINLYSRLKTAPFYLKNAYKPHLYIKIYKPYKTLDVKAANIKNFSVIDEGYNNENSYIILAVNSIDKADIKAFIQKIPTCNIQFLFIKKL